MRAAITGFQLTFSLGKRLVCTGWKRLVEEGVEFETLIFRKGMKIYLK